MVPSPAHIQTAFSFWIKLKPNVSLLLFLQFLSDWKTIIISMTLFDYQSINQSNYQINFKIPPLTSGSSFADLDFSNEMKVFIYINIFNLFVCLFFISY